MNIKIAGQSSKSNYRNTGSCGGAVMYNEHELRELPDLFQELGVEPEDLSWFDMDGHLVTGAEVIDKIGRLTAHLGKNDAKFYCAMINPSDEEALAMGATIDEQITNGRPYVFDVMDAYAKNFNREQIKDRHDLVAFAIPHIYKSERKQQIHWHVVLARLSRGFKVELDDGKYRTKHYKLSPLTNHRKTEKGSVRGGFDRIKLDRECERLFDQRYNYKRRVEQSFDYCLAEKKGSAEEKAAQETRLAMQNLPELEESIKQAITRRVERLAREASDRAEMRLEAEEKARIEAEKIEKANKNRFWNNYNSHYKPLIEKVQKSIEDTVAMRNYLSEQIGDCSREINEKYNRLRYINQQIELEKANIEEASTSMGLITALAGIVTAINPVAGLILTMVGRILTEGDRQAAYEIRKALYAEAKYIRRDIEHIKEQQAEYRAEDDEMKDALVKDKTARTELFNEINALKEQLTKPVVPSEEEIQELKRKYPFKEPGHIMYIVHSSTDASIFHSGEKSKVFRRKNIKGGTFDDDRIENARILLRDKGYMVAGDRGPDDFYDRLLVQQQYEDYRIGNMFIQADGKVIFGEEKIFGNPENTEPALKYEPEPVRAAEVQQKQKEKEQQSAPAAKPAKPDYEIVARFSDGENEFRIKKEADGTCKLQQLDWDDRSVVNGKATTKAWYKKAQFTAFKVLDRDSTHLYLRIKDLSGKTRYINQYGNDLSDKQLQKLGIGTGNGYGGPKM